MSHSSPYPTAGASTKGVFDVKRFSQKHVVQPPENSTLVEWIEEGWPEMRQRIVMEMTSKIVSDKVASDTYSDMVTIATPSSTWQMFKKTHEHSWWFGWFVRRRGVVVDTQTHVLVAEVDRYLCYPDVRIRDFGKPFIFEDVRRELLRDGG